MSASRETERQGRTHDLRLLPAAVAAWIGMWLATSGSTPALVVAAMVAVAVGAVGVARSAPVATIAAVVLLGSLLAGGLRAHALMAGPVAELAADRAVVSLVVRITTEPDTVTSTLGWGDQVRVGAEVLQLDGRGQAWAVRQSVMIEASGDRVRVWEGTQVGATVAFDARLGPADVADGVAAEARALSVPATVSEPEVWLVAVAAVRAGLRQAASTLPDDRRALVPALTLGDTSQVSRELSDQFRATGLTHLMAVSGAKDRKGGGVRSKQSNGGRVEESVLGLDPAGWLTR